MDQPDQLEPLCRRAATAGLCWHPVAPSTIDRALAALADAPCLAALVDGPAQRAVILIGEPEPWPGARTIDGDAQHAGDVRRWRLPPLPQVLHLSLIHI
jgi:hypothetical protein